MKLHFNAQLHRKPILWSMGGILASQLLVMLPVDKAEAHGAVGFPIARQYQCQLEAGFWGDPANIPNSDCRQAIENPGDPSNPQLPFTQWNELSANPTNPSIKATVELAVPNGLLCAGGDPRKAGLDNVPATKWRKTLITPDENGHMQLRWENTTAHNPAYMKVYITKPSYDSTKALRWEDLELLYADKAPTPTAGTGLSPSTNSFYFLNVPLNGHTGDAIIYSYWQREDAGNEGFFNCSDVNISEGSTPSFPWVNNSQFIVQGFTPAINDQIRFRVMGGSAKGVEVVDVYLPITAQNQAQTVWSKQLADKLNNTYPQYVRIGVRSGNDIVYNTANIATNIVWLQTGFSSAMSLISGTPEPEQPQPPVAQITAPSSVQDNETITLSASASTGQIASYQWEFQHFEPKVATTQNVTVRAVATQQPLAGKVTLTVTNNQGVQSRAEKTINILPSGGIEQEHPLWDRNKVTTYGEGTTVIGLDGQAWTCKPFPFTGWCAQTIPDYIQSNNWPYAPGSAAAATLSEDSRPWLRTVRTHH
ncbi:chitin binding domain-containing protein [Yersinia pseudotuberculosis]|uniref:lytic polysaccharide monooxygenase n=1 Tax=Yersinia pseudotuberculosis TaxID=633 RepID=UPI0005EA1B8C|nr:lytic polysaccharide monooxygenase [Yersinia pseudotuberculosis]CNL53081.1 chitin binding domain-containing protein [Yersinia pseudotuberculosis]